MNEKLKQVSKCIGVEKSKKQSRWTKTLGLEE